MIYCDTSVMVAFFSTETNSVVIERWLEQTRGRIAISGWVITEFSGALATKRRMGILTSDAWRNVMVAWRGLCRDRVEIVSVSEADFLYAAQLMNRENLVLRSGDALHLSIAVSQGFSLATLDKKFAAAALKIGVPAETLGDSAPRT